MGEAVLSAGLAAPHHSPCRHGAHISACPEHLLAPQCPHTSEALALFTFTGKLRVCFSLFFLFLTQTKSFLGWEEKGLQYSDSVRSKTA